jgi:hypothetical protein
VFPFRYGRRNAMEMCPLLLGVRPYLQNRIVDARLCLVKDSVVRVKPSAC